MEIEKQKNQNSTDTPLIIDGVRVRNFKNMNVMTKNNNLFVDGKQVSNFTIKRLQENKTFEIDNEKTKKLITLNSGSLMDFKCRIYEQGNYIFEGTKKQLDGILDLLPYAP